MLSILERQGVNSVSLEPYDDDAARFWLVFHGGFGSELSDIHESLEYGVDKMNVDTDTQYHFTQAVVKHVDESHSELTHTAEGMANKKKFDKVEVERVVGAIEDELLTRVNEERAERGKKN